MPKTNRDKRLMEMARDGIKYPVIAEDLGISVATVSRICIKFGLRSGRREFVSSKMAETWHKMMFEDGKTSKEIAKHEPFEVNTINLWIQRHKRKLEEKNKKPKNDLEAARFAIEDKSMVVKSKNWRTLRRVQ